MTKADLAHDLGLFIDLTAPEEADLVDRQVPAFAVSGCRDASEERTQAASRRGRWTCRWPSGRATGCSFQCRCPATGHAVKPVIGKSLRTHLLCVGVSTAAANRNGKELTDAIDHEIDLGRDVALELHEGLARRRWCFFRRFHAFRPATIASDDSRARRRPTRWSWCRPCTGRPSACRVPAPRASL
jgi:hypothetical protein